MAAPHVEIHDASATELDAPTLYGLLRLRVEVLIVEPQAAYLDLDGRDLQEGTQHVWASSDENEVVGYVRVTREANGETRIGRLCTAHHARGRGVARKLVTRAIELAGDGPIITGVQTHLAPWYQTFGFVITGPMFHDIGIPHTPMRLER